MGSLSQQASEQAGGGQTCGLKLAGLNIFSAVNPYSFFVAQQLAETQQHSWEKLTLHIPQFLLLQTLSKISSPSFTLIELQLLIHKAACIKARRKKLFTILYQIPSLSPNNRLTCKLSVVETI